MATPWDRTAKSYVDVWVPRFTPYHNDLVKELKLAAGDRVLITCCGPGGAEALAAARAVGDHGFVRATDADQAMVDLCSERLAGAGFKTPVECAKSDAADVTGDPWDAIVCAFGLWKFDVAAGDRERLLTAWSQALTAHGKVGILTWGPVEEDDPFERFARCLSHVEPGHGVAPTRIPADREAMDKMFEAAGLSMVRHTVLRHTLTFARAEEFVQALREAGTWSKVCEDLGEERLGRVAARFFSLVGGPDAPLSWQPAATLAVAAYPGTEVAVESRSNIKVPTIPPPPSNPPPRFE